MDKHDKKINFKIDKNNYEITESQNPVTGEFLRGLPPVPAGYDLWLRGKGNEDDRLISAADKVEIENGDHFYTSRQDVNPGGEA
jgi:hypothetical protein